MPVDGVLQKDDGLATQHHDHNVVLHLAGSPIPLPLETCADDAEGVPFASTAVSHVVSVRRLFAACICAVDELLPQVGRPFIHATRAELTVRLGWTHWIAVIILACQCQC
jgi:hypothetical protein